jgi:drug/metabolite transporter (DMT)-like permease
MMLALVAALVGLFLAVGLSLEKSSDLGLALAVIAMFACVLVLLLCERAAKSVGGLAIVFYMMLAASGALGVLFLLVGEPKLPTGTTGWLGFVGVAFCSTLGSRSSARCR